MEEDLRGRLVAFVRGKFYSRPSVGQLAEDIVSAAFVELYACRDPERIAQRENFGWMSKACIHEAWRVFRRESLENLPLPDTLGWMDGDAVVDELMEAQDTQAILNSLEVLRQIERRVVLERYFGDYTFAQIARHSGLKLSTVLSHHRRALEKLRGALSEFSSGRSKPACRELPAGQSRHFNL